MLQVQKKYLTDERQPRDDIQQNVAKFPSRHISINVDTNLIVVFWRLQVRVFVFNRLRAIWPEDYQRGSLRNSQQNGDYSKQAMRKSYARVKYPVGG